jgi:hypothetical protein
LEGVLLTLFAVPKAFRGHFEIIQRNAITSWTLLQPRPEIILFGDEEGTAEVANEFGVLHIRHIARNEYGTPLVNDLFTKAQSLASYDLLCYFNADIILMNDFTEAVYEAQLRGRRFLMIGQRWDIEVKEPLDFAMGWEESVRSLVRTKGQLSPGTDYFLFSRGICGEIPPFAIGRIAWDNWLIYRARHERVMVIDATEKVMAVHQNHDYAHVSSNAGDGWEGPEAEHNRQLVGGLEHIFGIYDATHKLTRNGLRLAVSLRHVRRHLEAIPLLYFRLTWPGIVIRKLIRVARLVRLALRKATTPGRPE